MLYRNQIRTIKNSTETSLETTSIVASALSFVLLDTDAFYVGYHKPFTTRYFNLATANTNACTITVTYWDGSAWTAVEDKVDQTIGFTTSGFIAWQNPGGWQAHELSPVSDVKLYWVRLKVSTTLSAGTSLQSVNNLFCDAVSLRAMYPELVYDTRYLPPGRTTFLEQFEAAKDLTVLRLKQKRAIDDESEVIDINEVNTAATHATAYLIRFATARSEEAKAEAQEAYNAFERELNLSTFSFDEDNSGTLTTTEEAVPTVFRARW